MTEPIKIIFFGDSITECRELPEEETWVYLSEQKLNQAIEQKTFTCINKGVCGETSRMGLLRIYEDVLKHEPQAVIFQFGTNDSIYWKSYRGQARVSLASFEANLHEAIQMFKAFDIPSVYFTTIHHLGLSRKEINQKTHEENLQAYNACIRHICNQTHSRLIDIQQALSSHHPDTYTSDGIHLNTFGCELYSQETTRILLNDIKTLPC